MIREVLVTVLTCLTVYGEGWRRDGQGVDNVLALPYPPLACKRTPTPTVSAHWELAYAHRNVMKIQRGF